MGLIATGQGRRSSSGDGGGGGRRQQRRRRALLPVRMAASGGLVLVALLAVAVAQLQHQWGAHAYTRPDQREYSVTVTAAVSSRGQNVS